MSMGWVEFWGMFWQVSTRLLKMKGFLESLGMARLVLLAWAELW